MNENQFGVILENILDKVNAIGEGQKTTDEKLDKLEIRFDRMEKKIDNLELRMTTVENKIDQIELDVKSLKEDNAVIKKYIMSVDDTLIDHEHRFQTLKGL